MITLIVQCCQCTRGMTTRSHVAKPEKHYSVRSMALRGDNDETLEVCLTSEPDPDHGDPTAQGAGAQCSACPPACNDPNCVACLQKCPHGPESWHRNRHSKITKYKGSCMSGDLQ